jgi:hypothetical protein
MGNGIFGHEIRRNTRKGNLDRMTEWTEFVIGVVARLADFGMDNEGFENGDGGNCFGHQFREKFRHSAQ